MEINDIINKCKECGDCCEDCPFDGGAKPWTYIDGAPVYCYLQQFPETWDMTYITNIYNKIEGKDD